MSTIAVRLDVRSRAARVVASRLTPALAASALLLAALGCEPDDPRKPNEEELGRTFVLRSPDVPLVHPAMARLPAFALAEEEGQWIRPLKDFAGSRYSTLDEINAGNVHRLRLAWSYDMQLVRGQEATPLVIGSTMYVVGSYPNPLLAFDLTQPGPVLRWVYTPEQNPAAQGVACCDHVNRGAAYANGRLFYATLDAHAIAVDAASGQELWKVKIGEVQIGETVTMSPLVVGEVVMFGNSGAEFGVRGWLKALSAATGEVLWTAFSTGPDEDVLIGQNFRPFYRDHLGPDLGVTTWPVDHWRIGGGNVWGWLTYDPELDLVYYGTANAAPWNPEMRPGENKWTATIFARRPATGEAIWAYQWDPHNYFDWDGVNENLLLDMPINGTMRRVLARAERNGYVYIIDRETGEPLYVDQFVYANAHLGVDLQTGRPQKDLSKSPGFGRTARDICPSVPGAKDWEPKAFSPRTGLLYIPANNMCMDMEGVEANFIAGTPYMGTRDKMFAGPGGHLGELLAWDPARREKVWTIKERFLTWSGPLATAGDVVFYGTMDRWFKAVDARTGQTLWRFQTNTGIIAPPMTYLGPDGRQYVAVLSGPGGWAGSIVSVPLDPRDSTADKGIVNAMHQLPQYTDRGGFLYVFRLP